MASNNDNPSKPPAAATTTTPAQPTTASLAVPPSIFSPFLDDQRGRINAKGVSWDGYQRAKLVSAEEVALLKKLERLPQPSTSVQGTGSQRAALFATEGKTYARLYIDLLAKLQKVDTVQCVLVGISNMIADPVNLQYFHDLESPSSSSEPSGDGDNKSSTTTANGPYPPLLKCLGLQDEFVQLEALRILAVLVATDARPLQDKHVEPLMASITKLVDGNASSARDLAIQALGATLSSSRVRRAVWENETILPALLRALESAGPNPSPQLQYWIMFCFWELSFEGYVAGGIEKRLTGGVVGPFTEAAKHAAKEKIVRVAIAMFRNLLKLAPEANLPSLLAHQVLPFVTSLASRKFQDEEIQDDVVYVRDELKTRLEGMTTWDEYASEVESGHLTWSSAAHTSDDFWKENAERVGDEQGGKVLDRLVSLMSGGGSASRDPITLAVAAHDVGQYVKHGGDHARKLVSERGGKVRVMELMSHESADVKYQALMTVQRLMSHAWAN